ncbi:MAG: hypothetical protein V1708_01110 [Candidatus Micrarchaeota archaeon]
MASVKQIRERQLFEGATGRLPGLPGFTRVQETNESRRLPFGKERMPLSREKIIELLRRRERPTEEESRNFMRQSVANWARENGRNPSEYNQTQTLGPRQGSARMDETFRLIRRNYMQKYYSNER